MEALTDAATRPIPEGSTGPYRLSTLFAGGVILSALAGAGFRLAGPAAIWSDADGRMRLHCAIVLLILAVAILLLARLGTHRGAGLLSRALSIGVAGWGMLLLFPAVGPAPGGPHTSVMAIGFILIGFAAAAIRSRSRLAFHAAEAAAVVCTVTSAAATLAHIYRAAPVEAWSIPAVETDVAILFASLGVLFLHRERGIGALLRGEGLGSRLARPLLAASLLLPPLLEVVAARSVGIYGTRAVTAMHSILISAIATAIILVLAAWLEQLDRARREAVRAVEESEERLRLQIERMPIGCIVWTRAFRVVSWNPAAEEIFGFTEEEMLGRDPFGTIVPESLRAYVHSVWESLMDREEHPYSVNENLTRDGRTILCSWSNTPLVRADGEVIGVVSMVQDVTEKTRTERELRENEERYRDLVEHSNDLICTHDLEGRILSVNPAVERAVALPAEAIRGRNVRDLLAPAVQGQFADYLRTILVTGSASGTMSVLDASGSRRTWEYQNTLRVENGIPVIVRGMARDVTEQRRAESLLRRSEALYRSILDTSPNVVFSFDREGRFRSANRRLCDILGVAERDLIGRADHETGFLEGSREEWTAHREMATFTRKPCSYRASWKRGDVQRLYDLFLSPLIDAGGEVTGVSGIALDVTEQVRAAESLTRLSQAVEQADEVIFMTDREGTITYANPAFQSIYGFTQDEILGSTPRLIKSALYSAADYESFWAKILRGETVRGEATNRRKDGSLICVQRSVSPVFNGDDKIIGFLSVQTDMSERKRMEEEQEKLSARMVQAAKMEAIGTLAGGIAHDFNNILSIILSFATLAERSRNDEARFSKAFDTIRQAVQRGADLSKQILTFARRGESSPEAVDLNRIANEIAGMARGTFSRSITVETALAGDMPLIVGDSSQLHQALLNLCVNARDAMSGLGGTISIRTAVVAGSEVRERFPDAPDGEYAHVEVADTGVGIPPEVQQRIFEPFFTTKADGRGTGLGLAVTYGVVNAAGGFIGVRSEVGRGSKFDVFLPVPTATVGSQGDCATSAPGPRGSETILLVEDEPELLPILADSLREFGYEVIASTEGNQALRLYEEHRGRIRIVISDDGLPGLAGRDLFHTMRRRDPALPFVLVSGFVETDTLGELQRAGLNRFLQKPYEVSLLVATVREVLDAAVGSDES